MNQMQAPKKTKRSFRRKLNLALLGLLGLLVPMSGCQFASDVTPQSITKSLAYPAPVSWGKNSEERNTSPVRQYQTGDWSQSPSGTAPSVASDPLFALPRDGRKPIQDSGSRQSVVSNAEKAQREAYLEEYQTWQTANQIHTDFRRQAIRQNRKRIPPIKAGGLFQEGSNNPFRQAGESGQAKIADDFQLFQEQAQPAKSYPKLPPAPSRFQESVDQIARTLPDRLPFTKRK